MNDEIRWNLRLKRVLHDKLGRFSKELGVAKSDIARLALIQFMHGVGEKLSLRMVRDQLRSIETQLEAAEGVDK